MIEVLPIQSKAEQEALCARCGVAYKPDAMAYRILAEDGSPLAVSQFKMSGGVGYLEDIAHVRGTGSSPDRLFVLGRATLNFIDLCGTHKAVWRGGNIDEKLLFRIGFSKNSDGVYTADLTELFKSPCTHN